MAKTLSPLVSNGDKLANDASGSSAMLPPFWQAATSLSGPSMDANGLGPLSSDGVPLFLQDGRFLLMGFDCDGDSSSTGSGLPETSDKLGSSSSIELPLGMVHRGFNLLGGVERPRASSISSTGARPPRPIGTHGSASSESPLLRRRARGPIQPPRAARAAHGLTRCHVVGWDRCCGSTKLLRI